ncbi:hypothetical protein JS533_009660 [Bifidobacterium amazonense]|uniref:DUF4192 family protein n=1 Tax=Bifidobacterium amazonense TaxID=2809027 RepID=A0ABS9VWN8_9BIFI|nr:hypothetical protein [Bifidobacterium amazonense]MCH9276528.1 hypothetical protein [Bifidobacterium amazonense]
MNAMDGMNNAAEGMAGGVRACAAARRRAGRAGCVRRDDGRDGGRGRGRREDGGEPMFEPLRTADLETLTASFRHGRRERGARTADAAWLEGPFDAWMERLDDGPGDCCMCGCCDAMDDADGCCDPMDHDPTDPDMDDVAEVAECDCPCDGCAASEDPDDLPCPPLRPEHVAALAVAMRETLPARDALIMSLIAGRECDGPLMMRLAADPHSTRTKLRLTAMLTRSFKEEGMPDAVRCAAGMLMLSQIADMVPRRWRAQPCAAMAYVMWWMDDDRAALYALESLACDEGCTLGGVVLSLLERGVCPGWCR